MQQLQALITGSKRKLKYQLRPLLFQLMPLNLSRKLILSGIGGESRNGVILMRRKTPNQQCLSAASQGEYRCHKKTCSQKWKTSQKLKPSSLSPSTSLSPGKRTKLKNQFRCLKPWAPKRSLFQSKLLTLLQHTKMLMERTEKLHKQKASGVSSEDSRSIFINN